MDISNNNRKSNYFIASLSILLLTGTYLFGLRVLVLFAVNIIFAILLESFFYKKIITIHKTSIVTVMIYTLVLPASMPFHLSILGLMFGLFFSKLIFGGDNYYIFSPALIGRAFLQVSFVQALSNEWIQPTSRLYGGFIYYLGKPIDSMATATPLLQNLWANNTSNLSDLLIGRVSGSIGETSALIILIIAVILLIKRVIPASIVFSAILSAMVICTIHYLFIISTDFSPLHHLFSGGLLFGIVFIATDSTTMPKDFKGRLIYGTFIGFLSMVIRLYATSTEGVMYAILVANMIAPFIDYVTNTNNHYKLKGGEE